MLNTNYGPQMPNITHFNEFGSSNKAFIIKGVTEREREYCRNFDFSRIPLASAAKEQEAWWLLMLADSSWRGLFSRVPHQKARVSEGLRATCSLQGTGWLRTQDREGQRHTPGPDGSTSVLVMVSPTRRPAVRDRLLRSWSKRLVPLGCLIFSVLQLIPVV